MKVMEAQLDDAVHHALFLYSLDLRNSGIKRETTAGQQKNVGNKTFPLINQRADSVGR